MQVARYDPAAGVQHLWLAPIATARRP
jgi:hypothetical protein